MRGAGTFRSKKLKRLAMPKFQNKNLLTALIAAAAAVIIGAVLLSTKAAGFFGSTEAESGTKSAQAVQVADTSASGGQAVKFTAPSGGGGDETGSCTIKPNATNVGASGALTTISTGDMTIGDGETLENVYLTNGGITVGGDNVTIRNVHASGGLFIYLSDSVLVDHFTGNDASAISSSTNVTIQYSNLGPVTDDGIHVTSDRGSMNTNIKLLYNYVHDPNVPSDAHYDGTQVRGVNGLTINCSNYDAGTYQPMYNSEIYLENANGGNSNVTISNNWLYGAGYVLMMNSNSNTHITGNRFGGDIHWGYCYKNNASGESYPGFSMSGNIDESSGAPVTCT
jgi:hypothetical protein